MGVRQPILQPPLPQGCGEAPTSLLSRHAHLHGRRLAGFCRDLGLDLQGIADGVSKALRTFAALIGADAGALEVEALRKVGDKRFEHKGETLTSATLRRAARRICPLCVAEDVERADGARHAVHHAYGRSLWLLDPIRSCPHHGVALVAVAHSSNPGEAHDFAGAVVPLLNDLGALRARAVPVGPSPMEAYLRDRLEGVRGPAFLDGLAWHAAADACQSLGAVALHGAKVRLLEMDEDDWRAAGDAGHAAACDGEDGIRTLLSRLDADFEGSRGSKDGPQARYGSAFKRLAFTPEERDFDPLREIVKRHVLETTAVGPEDRLFGEPFERRVLHSVHSAASAYGVHPKRLRTILVAKGVLDAASATVTDERCVFDAAENDALLWTSANSVSLTEAETYLGAGRVQAKLLADAGIIRPFVELVRTWRGEVNYAVPDLDAFLGRLLRHAQAVDRAPPGSYDIPAAAKRANCSAVEIVRLVLDRRLGWIGRVDGVAGYMSVLVDLDEVKRHVHGPAFEGLNARDLEERLKATTRTVAALIEHGHLPTSTIVHPVNRCPTRVVDPADVDGFEATYVSLNRLAEERGMHFRRLLKSIEAAEVRPALTREIYHATFYKRADTTMI